VISRRAGLMTLGCLLGSLLLSVALWAKPAPEPVSILMPAPFADATAELVETFNREHPGIALSVTRGPLEQKRCRTWPSAACCWATVLTTLS
jgi:multiple sugar transport system substrate-binding protein